MNYLDITYMGTEFRVEFDDSGFEVSIYVPYGVKGEYVSVKDDRISYELREFIREELFSKGYWRDHRLEQFSGYMNEILKAIGK